MKFVRKRVFINNSYISKHSFTVISVNMVSVTKKVNYNLTVYGDPRPDIGVKALKSYTTLN